MAWAKTIWPCVAAAFIMEPVRKEVSGAMKELKDKLPPDFAEMAIVHEHIQSGRLALNLSGETLLKITLDAENEESAAELEKLLGRSKDELQRAYPKIRKGLSESLPPDVVKDALALADRVPDAFNVARSGSEVTLTLKSPGDLAALAPKLKGLVFDPDGSGTPPKPPGGDGPAASVSEAEQKARQAAAKVGGYIGNPHAILSEPALEFQFRSDPQPTDADLEKLRPLLEAVPRGVGLNLNQDGEITDAGIAHLKGMANLRALSIGGTKVTPKCLDSIKTLKNLEQLYMETKDVADDDLAQLAGLTKLRDLTIHSEKLSEAGLLHLKDLTNMRKFYLCRGIGDLGLGHIKGWTKVEVLALTGDIRTHDGLTDVGAAHLKHFTELRELRLEYSNITDVGLANLAVMSKLEDLTLSDCEKITDAGLDSLKGLTSLKKFRISACHEVHEVGIANLAACKGLKSVQIGFLGANALKGLAGVISLEELTCQYGASDEALAQIKGLTNLRQLELSGCLSLTDAGLVYLKDMKNLQSLEMTGDRQINGSGLVHLKGLTKLKKVYLTETAVTDDSLAALEELPALESLCVRNTKVTKEGVAAFQKAKPKVQVSH